MSQNRKVIEYEGVKYCKEEGLWYQMLQIREDKLPDAIKTERQLKFNLLPEIQLDVFKCLDFAQLLSVQQTNVYFKNFIYEHGKVLAMKKFYKLEILPISERTIYRFLEHKPQPKLYDFDLGDYRFTSNFGMCEQKYKFFKPEPRLYEFELGEELEKKWKDGIKNSIPMFLTMGGGTNIKTAVCEFDHEGKLEKDLYYMQLSKYPKNLEEMKIARYFFQLLFNCSFDNFRIHQAIINPQMIELLFVNEIARNVPLQIHSQETWLLLYDDHLLNFLANHLVTNHFYVEFDDRFDEEENVDILFKILAIGGIKSSRITFLHLSSKLYNCIIENIAASQDIFKMPNEIGFNGIWGPLISSERATNVEVTTVEDELKCTKFQLVNKYNPKMVFSVSIEECYTDIHVAGQENKEIGVIAEIKKIE